MRTRVIGHAAIVSAALLVAVAAVVFAGDPITWGRPWASNNQQLSWKFASSTYPSWLVDAAKLALEQNWDDRESNNSQTAQFNYAEAGQGTVIYSSSAISPCVPSLANEQWLASACKAGDKYWKIYIHNFDKAPYSNWTWWDKTKSCPSGKTCFQLRRTLIHEPIHLTGGGSTHSKQSPDVTVFTVGQRSNAYAPGRIYNLLQCDEAGAQKAYDLRDLSGRYSPCLGSLKTAVSVTGTFQACQGLPVLVGGRLAVQTTISTRLNGNPLAGRVVKLGLDGELVAEVKAYSISAGNNWAVWLTNPGFGIRTYRAHFDGESPLAASTQTVAITWVPRSQC